MAIRKQRITTQTSDGYQGTGGSQRRVMDQGRLRPERDAEDAIGHYLEHASGLFFEKKQLRLEALGWNAAKRGRIRLQASLVSAGIRNCTTKKHCIVI